MRKPVNHRQDDPIEITGRFSGIETVIRDHGMRFEAIMLTPPLAELLLTKLHPQQRPIKEFKVATFMADMKAGRWWLNPQPLIVDEDGFVCNGRNRLTACVRARVAVPMWICYGASRKATRIYDTGTLRSVADAAAIDGKPMPHSGYPGVVRAMAGSIAGKSNLSVQEVLDWASTYGEGIDFAFARRGTEKPMTGVMTAMTRAVLARAYYSAPRERLTSFAEQLATGLIDSKKSDSAVILLRNWLINAAVSGGGQGSRAARKQTYGLTEFALSEYLESRRPTQLLCVSSEQFPLPDLKPSKG